MHAQVTGSLLAGETTLVWRGPAAEEAKRRVWMCVGGATDLFASPAAHATVESPLSLTLSLSSACGESCLRCVCRRCEEELGELLTDLNVSLKGAAAADKEARRVARSHRHHHKASALQSEA
jgi:hypothetical protein